MYRLKRGALCTIALATLMLASCSTTTIKPSAIDIQRSAMQRWNACLESNINSPSVTVTRIAKLLTQNCEGHKRDVIATFPKHLAEQIDQKLTSNAYQLVVEDDVQEFSSQQSALLKTLLR